MLLGIVGYPRVGKDALAERLVRDHGFVRLAFGDAVKSALLRVDPAYGSLRTLEMSKIYGALDTREKLQNLGQLLREVDPNYWVRWVEERLEVLPPGSRVVITDIRYPNEYDLVRRFSGHVVGIDRPGHGPVNDHVSETNTTDLLREVDAILINDGPLEALTTNTMEVLHALSSDRR